MPWQADLALAVEDLCHFEAAKNVLFEDAAIRSICQYDLLNHPPTAIHTALRTHPFVILNDKVHDNPYYEAPTILDEEPWSFGSNAAANDIQRWLSRFG